jgi:phosphoribosylanthranilate isomerase
MSRTRIKICGVRDVSTALAAAHAGADAVGLVFVEGSPRQVSDEEAGRIVAALPAFVEPVGLFVDAPLERVLEMTEVLGLRTVQLHGQEDWSYVQRLAGLRVMKAFGFDADTIEPQLDGWRQSPTSLAAILLDAPPPETTIPGQQGGGGKTFDWGNLITRINHGLLADLPPMVLAGGLSPVNVGAAIREVRPYAVDVSSGVERTRGVKDMTLIEAFCDAVRQTDRLLD